MTLICSSTISGNCAGVSRSCKLHRGDGRSGAARSPATSAANGGSGGAINNVSGATLMAADSTLSDNSAALNGGGIDNFGTTMLPSAPF